MARGRMINTAIAEDEQFNEMSINAQFLFVRTIPHLDRDGLITGNPVLLAAKIAPLLTQLHGEIGNVIQEWLENEFVILYKDGKRDVLFFPSFRKNQIGMRYEREPESEFAPPPRMKRTKDGLVQDGSGGTKNKENNRAEECRKSAGEHTAEEKRREVEEKAATHARTQENTRNENAATAALPDDKNSIAASLEEKKPERYRDFINSYERIWGMMLASPYQAEKVEEWTQRVALAAWEYALEQSLSNRKHGNWTYFEKILKRVEVEGVTAQSSKSQSLQDSAPKLIDARDRSDIPDYLREALNGK